jgi:hypothetical protein
VWKANALERKRTSWLGVALGAPKAGPVKGMRNGDMLDLGWHPAWFTRCTVAALRRVGEEQRRSGVARPTISEGTVMLQLK